MVGFLCLLVLILSLTNPDPFLPPENDNTTPKDSETAATTMDSNAAPSSPAAIERQSSGDSSCELDEQQDQQPEQDPAKVKQEPYEEEASQRQQEEDAEEEEREQSAAKRPKMELVDAEANTVHTGEPQRNILEYPCFLAPSSPPPPGAHIWVAKLKFPPQLKNVFDVRLWQC